MGLSPYKQGYALGSSIEALREAGMNPDPRWDIADARKALSPEDFIHFMEGLKDALR